MSKFGKYAGFALTGIASGLKCFEEYQTYNASLELVKNYEDILDGLVQCGNENVETAAKTVKEDMRSTVSKYFTVVDNSISVEFSYGSAAFESYLLPGYLGIPGLILDLTWLVSSIVIGDKISNKILNFVRVDTTMGVDLGMDQYIKNGKYLLDTSGNVNILITGDEEARMACRFWTANIYAKKWCESKYSKGGNSAQSNAVYSARTAHPSRGCKDFCV